MEERITEDDGSKRTRSGIVDVLFDGHHTARRNLRDMRECYRVYV